MNVVYAGGVVRRRRRRRALDTSRVRATDASALRQGKFPRIILEMYLWAIETGLSKTETAFLPYFQPA